MNSAIRLLERAARLWPDKTAVEEDEGAVTYEGLLRRARRVGAALLRRGVQGGQVVVYLPKSIDALTVFFGTLCAGGAYVPVDAHIPMARLEKILDNLRPACVVTHEALVENLAEVELHGSRAVLLSELEREAEDGEAVDAAIAQVIDTDPIYLMYTSGSTGTPKGVAIPHRGILDYADWVVDTFAFDETTVMANQAPFYFDNSTFDIYGTLRCGGKLLLTPESLFLFPLKLPEYLEAHQVTSIFWVPTVMINVASSGALEGRALPRLRNVSFCGEVMPNGPLNVWRRALPHCAFANLYGPTEITDVCCYYKVEREFADHESLPIGRACENMRLAVLDEEGRAAQTGETGELCVTGSGVALGYWNAPELTERAFTQNPLNPNVPERMYRTGDLAYWGEDGLLYFVGRKDSQIKLKGNRIELGEVEAGARCIPAVTNACALLDREAQEIVLFVESADRTLTLRKAKLVLRQYMPAYMLPGRLVVMDKLPHTANDKIDRVSLGRTLAEERTEKQ